MNHKLIFSLILFVLAVMFAFAAGYGAQPLAFVKQVNGPAWVLRNESIPITKGMELKANDSIQTGQQASVEIRFCDHHTVQLGPKTRLRITGIEQTERKESVTVYLEVGRIMVDVWNRLQTALGFEVEAEAGIAGVRGTKFSVTVGKTGTMEVTVEEGLVELTGKNGNGKVEIAKGQSSAIAPGGSPSKPDKSSDKKSDSRNNSQSNHSGKGSGNGSGHGNGNGGHGGHSGGNGGKK